MVCSSSLFDAAGLQCLAHEGPSSQVDFVVPENSQHAVLLVSCDRLARYLGEESAAAVLRGGHLLACDPRLTHQLFAVIDRLIDEFGAQTGLLDDAQVCRAVESQLLGSVAELLVSRGADSGCASARGPEGQCMGLVDALLE